MKRFSVLLLLVLSAGTLASAQLPANLLKQVAQIKLLESNRDDVKRLLRDYEATDDSDHYQEFSNDYVDIEVTYSSGKCSDDPDDDEASDIWNVTEWKVTRIEISPNEPVNFRGVGVDPSKFKRSQRYPDDPESLVFHDKILGLAFKTTEEGIERIIVFPSRNKVASLCKAMTAAKGFYTRKGWFSASRPYEDHGDIDSPAYVAALDLDRAALESGSGNTIAVSTTAVDPENDVLTYNYQVSGGTITGNGARVIWDLSGLPPGTYTITAAVDDGCGLCGKTVTKTVTVK